MEFFEQNFNSEESAYLFMLNKVMEDLRDNYPEELSYALGDEAVNVDVSNESISNLSGYFIKGVFESATLADGTIDFDIAEENAYNFSDALSDEAKTSAGNKMKGLAESVVNQATVMDFSGTPSGRFSRSQDNFMNSNGSARNCNPDDCDVHIWNPSSSCYTFCQNNQDQWSATYGCPPDEPNCAESSGTSAFVNFLNGAIDVLGSAAQEIGAENIWNQVWGIEDTGDTSNYYINPETGEREEKPFNWGLLAIGVLVTVVVVGGIIYLVRKKD
jgi:hypothetical protein